MLNPRSNVNEVIRAVFIFFTSLLSFYKKICTHQKHQRHKKHEKHKKHENATKQKHKKHKNVNKQISDFFPLGVYKRIKRRLFYFCSLICSFVLFVRVKKRKLEKREKSPQCNVLNTDVPTTRLMY